LIQKNATKGVWQIVNRKGFSTLAHLKPADGTVTNDQKKIMEEFYKKLSSFSCNVQKYTDEAMRTSHRNDFDAALNEAMLYDKTCKDKVTHDIDEGDLVDLDDQDIVIKPEWVIPTPTESEIASIIKELKSKQSSGPDGISSVFIKRIATLVCRPLVSLFNLSLRAKKFPAMWNIGKDTPIYK